MALILHNSSSNPLGQFDADDSAATVLGGEVATLTPVLLTDAGAADLDDGYVGATAGARRRPGVNTALTSGDRPLFLTDDGTAGYGTLFGEVVGGTVGQVSTGGAVLGPHTALASGKITLWQQPGLYGVTLDAVDTTADGLIPSSTTGSLTVGSPVYANASGLLTPVVGESFEATQPVASFVEFMTNGALVTTPTQLVASLDELQMNLTQAVIYWNPPTS